MISKLRGRSWQEIRFRATQEIANLSMFLWAPSPGQMTAGPLAVLPNPKTVAAQLQSTRYAAEVERLAREIMAHRIPLLGLTVDTGPEINWRMDYPNGKASELRYMRRVPYLDFDAVGDHKNVWELNRHQHLVLLAQAYALTRNRDYLVEIQQQLESWMVANPFMRGINWTSALEVAFRTLSWIWIWHLASNEMTPELSKKMLTALHQHGRRAWRAHAGQHHQAHANYGDQKACRHKDVGTPPPRMANRQRRGHARRSLRQFGGQLRAGANMLGELRQRALDKLGRRRRRVSIRGKRHQRVLECCQPFPRFGMGRQVGLDLAFGGLVESVQQIAK